MRSLLPEFRTIIGRRAGSSQRLVNTSNSTTLSMLMDSSRSTMRTSVFPDPMGSSRSMMGKRFFVGERSFSSLKEISEDDVENRVVDAVKKHLAERIEDLRKELEEVQASSSAATEKQAMLEKMQTQVSNSSTWKDFGFDEFDRVEVLLEVEDAFGGHIIPDEEADKIQSVQEAIKYMQKERQQAEC